MTPIANIRLCLVYLTRLPIRLRDEEAAAELAPASWCFPLVGLLIGVITAAVAAFALWIGLTAWIAALLALATGVLLTGGLHEDGLADMADGFGGGWTRERRLEIMRDSRLGSYGALALGLSLLLRAATLAALADLGMLELCAALLVAHSGSRAVLPLFMAITPLARREGQSVSAGRPGMTPVSLALAQAMLLLLLVSLLVGQGFGFFLLACLLLAGSALAVRALAQRQIGGYTGDVLGGLEQSAELLVLLAALLLFQ